MFFDGQPGTLLLNEPYGLQTSLSSLFVKTLPGFFVRLFLIPGSPKNGNRVLCAPAGYHFVCNTREFRFEFNGAL